MAYKETHWSYRLFPFRAVIKDYTADWFRCDVLAGLTVAIILVPQSMAYASLAGLPPIYGLYASVLPPLIYAFFGSSRQLSVGPVAISSILVLAGLTTLATPGTPEFISLAVLTALVVGVMQLLMGVFRLGFLVNFLSHPIMMGFTSAAAVIIIASQLKSILGIDIERSIYVHEIIASAANKISGIHWPTLIIAIGGIGLMVALKKIKRNIPAALIAVILATLITAGLGLSDQGVRVVGDVPAGLPSLTLPSLTWSEVLDVAGLALMLTFIGLIESFAIARAIAQKRKDHSIDANQELVALGISKIGGAFMQAYPTTGSFSRSAVNDEAGAKTGVSSLVVSALIVLTLLFLTPLFDQLPYAILSSIIIVAVAGLIKWKEGLALKKSYPWEFGLMIATFALTIVLGIMPGVLSGVALSLVLMIYGATTPHVCEMGLLPDSVHYRNIHRFPEVSVDPRILILRFDSQLFFGNANLFSQSITKLVEGRGDTLQLVVLDARSINSVDASGEQAFRSLLEYLQEKKIHFYLAGAIGPLRDSMQRSGLMELIGEKNQFMLVRDAVEFYHSDLGHDESNAWSKHALQTNHPD